MKHKALSIRTFIGAENFEESRAFYCDLGFEEIVISGDMSFFRVDYLGFYLQDYYVKDWVDNSMVFLEVDDTDRYWKELKELELDKKYEKVRLSAVQNNEWGKSVFSMILQVYSGISGSFLSKIAAFFIVIHIRF